jgi:hypothetical protein
MKRQEKKFMQNKSGTIKATGIIALVFIVVAIAWYLFRHFGVTWVSSAPQQAAVDLSLWGDYSSVITAILMAIGLFSFGVLIIRSIAINRLLGWLAIIAGILMLVSLVNTFEGSLVSRIAYYVTEFWILATGLWLILRGVKNSESEPALTAAKA